MTRPASLPRGAVTVTGPGWAVTNYDGTLKPGRWDTEEDAIEHGLCGVYLLSGADVVHVSEDFSRPDTNGLDHGVCERARLRDLRPEDPPGSASPA